MGRKTIFPEVPAYSTERLDHRDLSELRFQTDSPSAFGISLRPEISGALFAVLGTGGGLYLSLNQLIPAWENYQKLSAKTAGASHCNT